MSRFFLDTNILVYADDLDEAEKAATAQTLIAQAFDSRSGVVSTQVLQEFYVVITKRLHVDAAIARRKVELLGRLDLVCVDLSAILGAIDLSRLYPLSFWDALIIKAASTSNCTVLYSEDMQHGQVIDGVRIQNPFIA